VLQTLSWLPRTEGAARLSFARRDEQTRLDVLYQAGAARVRFPRPATGAPPEAVLLNTAGGLTGGDHMSLDVTLGARAEATLTTAAAEKIYRARDGDATIGVKLSLGAGARLAWRRSCSTARGSTGAPMCSSRAMPASSASNF